MLLPGVPTTRLNELRSDFEKVLAVLASCEAVDKALAVPTEEFVRSQEAHWRERLAA